jgi:hypothetical protein
VSPWFSAVKYCPTGSAWAEARVCLRASSTALAKSGNHGIPTPEFQAGRAIFSNGFTVPGPSGTVLIPGAGQRKHPAAGNLAGAPRGWSRPADYPSW